MVVTVLTSIGQECQDIYGADSSVVVPKLAIVGIKAGMGGIICSGQEAKILRAMPELDRAFILTPGMKIKADESSRDHARAMTIADAVRAGVNGVVVGRDITQPSEGTPAEAVERVLAIIEENL